MREISDMTSHQKWKLKDSTEKTVSSCLQTEESLQFLLSS